MKSKKKERAERHTDIQEIDEVDERADWEARITVSVSPIHIYHKIE